MADDYPENDVLLLDQELLLHDDSAGDDALPLEPDILLLDTPLPVAGPMMTIDVRPVRRAGAIPEPNFGPGGLKSANPVSAGSRRASTPAFDCASPVTHLHDLVMIARQAAAAYRSEEARTRRYLFAALASAYDLSLAVMQDPRGFTRLLAQAGLKMQNRAPMTPILKLTFGADYDKTRLTEYAAVLAHGHRKLVPSGQFASFLEQAKGGLKGIVERERSFRRAENASAQHDERIEPRRFIAKRLRKLSGCSLDEFGTGDDEFILVIARRRNDGTITALGEVPRDVRLLERAARRLLSEQTERAG